MKGDSGETAAQSQSARLGAVLMAISRPSTSHFVLVNDNRDHDNPPDSRPRTETAQPLQGTNKCIYNIRIYASALV